MAQNARVVVSIDLPDAPTPQEASFVQDTLDSLNQNKLAATWSTTRATQHQVGRILACQIPHEIALAAGRDWASATDRTVFANGLSAQIDESARQGIALRTLVSSAEAIENRLDLLVKHRLSTVRTTTGRLTKTADLKRFGVVVAPESVDLHGEFAWWTGGPRGAVRRLLHQAIQQRDIAHIVINVQRVVAAQRQQAALAAIEDAGNRVRFGLSHSATLHQLASGHRVLRTGTGHSILRAA